MPTETSSRADLCVHQLVRGHAHRAPNAPALVAPNRAGLTYGRLWAQVVESTARLGARGVCLGDRVALVMPDGPDMAVALLSVSAAATVAPIGAACSQAEYANYFDELGVSWLVTTARDDSAVVQVARERRIPVIRIAVDPREACGVFTITESPESVNPEEPTVSGSQVAVVLTTSGTTARPKVIALTHANLCRSAMDTASSLELRETDRCLNVMTLCHSHGLVGGLLTSLSAGASVVCPAGFDAVRFFSWMDDLRPTWYTAAPTVHQAILLRVNLHRDVIARRRLRVIRSTSAALPDAVHRALESELGAPVIQSYGMTEATSVVTSNPLPPGVRKVGSVGVPCGVDVVVLNASGAPASPGQPGEITIRGERVIRAYDGREPEGDSSFVNGWFRTGDIGFFDADGYLFVTGRVKEQINRGGEKISPNEIDAVLLEHPAVAQACAFGVPHPTLGHDVAAAIILRPGVSCSDRELRALVASRLSYSKVPTRIVFVDSLPVGRTGKVSRNALADRLRAELSALPSTPAAPDSGERSPLEDTVAGLFAEVLGVTAVKRDDNFFELGGDSLLATQVIARLNSLRGCHVSLLLLFDNPTLGQFARALDRVDSANR